MTTGTPHFQGLRLREGREARGISATSLADLVGVTRQAVSLYETGGGTPRPEILQRISDVLNLPAAFFFRSVSEVDTGTIFYRSLSAATKTARTRAARRFQWLCELVEYLHEFVEFPKVNVPAHPADTAATPLTDSTIDDWAEQTRRFWGLGDGPISNVVWLLENNGVIVTRGALDADVLDALSSRMPNAPAPCVFLGTDKGSSSRSRLDAAHELGHLVLHHSVSKAQFSHPVQHRRLEAQAFRFANAFLLPSSAFARDFYLPTLEALQALKAKWHVSIGAMIKRATDLDLMPSEQARRLWVSYVRRGWRTGEPLEEIVPVEHPRLLRRSFEMLIEQGVESRAEIRARLPFSTADIEALAGLPHGYLEDLPPTVRLLVHKQRRTDQESQPLDHVEVGTVVHIDPIQRRQQEQDD
jgi:Zn-dependent peptidase ImmA (M78 family)/transcriptional regulator with XRE-family HTH domain